MQFNLTFNKPSASYFEGAAGLKIKIEGKGKVMFKPSAKESGRDVFPLSSRTRGGVGVTLGGKFADEFLKATKMDRGTHMALEQTSYGWIAGEAVEGKPSKIVPTARLWRLTDEQGAKMSDAPAKAPRKARTSSRVKHEGATAKNPRSKAAKATTKKTRAPRAKKVDVQAAEATQH